MSTFSAFSSAFSSVDPARLVEYLDTTSAGQRGMKHYMAAAHRGVAADRAVLDVGCGAGHDVELLTSFGATAIGVDPSDVMVREAAARAPSAPFVRGTGEALPFRDGAFAGARIERVLMHVDDPEAVLAETLRCVEPRGRVSVFEPDWSRYTVRTDAGDEPAGWLSNARHPEVGGRLWSLLEAVGCDVMDRVEELSVWRTLAELDQAIGIDTAILRAVEAGRISAAGADDWLAHQRERDAHDEFRSTIPKILVVAMKRRKDSLRRQ